MAAFLRKYGTGTGADVWIPIVKRAVVDFAVSADWTPASGDVKITIDGGTAANIGTLPTALTMGNTALWKFVFSDAELQGKVIVVTVADSATKAVEDQSFVVETYGHASAMYKPDYSDSVRLGLTALPNAAADAAGGLPISDAGGLDLDNRMPAAAAVMNLNVVYNTDFATNYSTTTDKWQVEANVLQIEGSDATNQIRDSVVDDATRIDASALNTAAVTTIPTINTAVGGLQTTLQGLVLYSGTIGSTGNDTTHVHLEIPAGVANDDINGLVVVLYDNSLGVYNVRHITDWVAATQLATLDSALPASPQNATDGYWILSMDLGRIYTRLGSPAGASMSADIAAVKSDTAAILVDTGTTLQGELDGIQADTEDIQSKIGTPAVTLADDIASLSTSAAPQLLQSTTIATLATQTSFTLTAGSADNDAYNGAVVVVTDQSTSTQKAVGLISDYVGSTKTITLSADPGIFTMAVGDTVDILANITSAPTVTQIRQEMDSNSTQLAAIVADTNELQTDWVNGGRLDLILDARASQTSVDTIDGIVDAILVDTAEIGVAGAGLTNINLPNQTMDIVGNITGNLSGSVGSVTGAVGSVTGNVGGNVIGSVASVSGTVGSVTGNVGGNVTGSVGSVLGGINTTGGTITTLDALDTAQDTQHSTTQGRLPAALVGGRIDATIDATGMESGAVDAILDEQIGDGTITARQALRLFVASLVGKLSGAATTTVTIRNAADTQNVIVATVDADGNRSAVTLNP